MKRMLIILALLTLLLAPFTSLHAAETRRSNILFILTDDQSPFDFKFNNPQSTLNSPNLDRLASSGMIIDSAHHMGAFPSSQRTSPTSIPTL